MATQPPPPVRLDPLKNIIKVHWSGLTYVRLLFIPSGIEDIANTVVELTGDLDFGVVANHLQELAGKTIGNPNTTLPPDIEDQTSAEFISALKNCDGFVLAPIIEETDNGETVTHKVFVHAYYNLGKLPDPLTVIVNVTTTRSDLVFSVDLEMDRSKGSGEPDFIANGGNGGIVRKFTITISKIAKTILVEVA